MHETSFLADFVITLTAALLVLLPSLKLRIPPAVGFLITGTLIGPGALGLISDPEHVRVLAEVGVSVLLFMIGLEFSLARLKEIRRSFLLGGPLQVLGTIAIVAGALLLFPVGASPGQAVFAGMLVALSSTAMVLPILTERGEIHSPQGRLLLGILLFQDFAIVPMLALTPALGGTPAAAAAPRALVGILAAALVFFLARYVMPRVVGAVIRTGVRELYVMMAVAACLGASLATKSLGLSPALGAFLAGILVSESEYAHQIVSEILPFRDLFSSLFFIAVGMLLQLNVVGTRLGEIGGWLLLVVIGKALIAVVAVRILGFPSRIAWIAGISLAQVGEFSFVLAMVGKSQGILSAVHHQEFVAVAVLSLALTPLLARGASWFAARELSAAEGAGAAKVGAAKVGAAKWRGILGIAGTATGSEGGGAEGPEGALSGHVIIVGYGVNGHNLARVLGQVGIPYVVLEMDPALVQRARAEGQPIRFGDASRSEGLLSCGIKQAATVVLAISDPAATRMAVALTRSANPAAHIIARTRLVSEVAELARLGADEVIPEEFETSIAIFTRVLRHFHVPSNIVRLQEQALRVEGYSFLRGGDRTGSLMDSVSRMIVGATTDTYYLEAGSPVIGRTLQAIDLRGRTRALVIAVVREGKHHLGPEADFEFREGDILVLVGDHAALEAAYVLLRPTATSLEEDAASLPSETGPER